MTVGVRYRARCTSSRSYRSLLPTETPLCLRPVTAPRTVTLLPLDFTTEGHECSSVWHLYVDVVPGAGTDV